MKQLFHTPEGVRDVYGTECEKKLYLQEKLQKVFHAYGYQDIDCLLYTSPSPRDKSRSRMPSSA